MKIDVKIEGFSEILSKLKEIDQETAAKILVQGVNSSMLVMQNAAKKNLIASDHVDTGLLRDSIKRKPSIYANENRICITMGIDSKIMGVDRFGKKRIPRHYAHLVENGTKDKRIEGAYFIKKAFDEKKIDVLNKMTQVWTRKLDKYLNK